MVNALSAENLNLIPATETRLLAAGKWVVVKYEDKENPRELIFANKDGAEVSVWYLQALPITSSGLANGTVFSTQMQTFSGRLILQLSRGLYLCIV